MANIENENTPLSRFEMRAPKALTDKLMSYIAPDSGWVPVTNPGLELLCNVYQLILTEEMCRATRAAIDAARRSIEI